MAHKWKVGDYFFAPYVPESLLGSQPWDDEIFPVVGRVIEVHDDEGVRGSMVWVGSTSFKGPYYFPFSLVSYANDLDQAHALVAAHALTGEVINPFVRETNNADQA